MQVALQVFVCWIVAVGRVRIHLHLCVRAHQTASLCGAAGMHRTMQQRQKNAGDVSCVRTCITVFLSPALRCSRFCRQTQPPFLFTSSPHLQQKVHPQTHTMASHPWFLSTHILQEGHFFMPFLAAIALNFFSSAFPQDDEITRYRDC